MKDLVKLWNRRCSPSGELKDLSHNRLKKTDIDNLEANFIECEVLNNKFNDDLEFNNKKDAIINRLFERRKRGQVGRQPKCLFVLLMLGFFALAAGCFILFLKPYDFFFRQKALLSDGGETFEMWRKPEVELYLKVYLFNVTNAEEYMSGEEDTIKFKEVGPYVYREGLQHTSVVFNENDTLSAIPVHPLSWVQELSEGNTENDTLYLVNIALLSIANVVSQKDAFTRFGLNNLISFTNSQPFVQMTAREFMMGYKSELMTLGNTFLPGWIYFDKLGLIDRMYDFDGDYETVFTGADDIRKSGLLDTYRGSTDLPQWQGKYCSNVQNASDGTKFRGAVAKNESLLFYRKSLCRTARLVPIDEGVRSGLHGYKYTFMENMFDNGKYVEENKCFCRQGKCLPAGLLDVADCYYGFPISLSYPHFWKADDIVLNKIEGLHPDEEKHQTEFWIEPSSGIPLEVSAKVQINMALDDISSIRNVEKFANMHIPLLWFDIKMYELPPSMRQRFGLYLNILPVVEQSSMYLLFITGIIFILTTIYILTFKVMFRKPRDFEHWNEKDGIYARCEIPISDTETDNENSKTLLKTHSEKFKDLSNKIGDRMYDTVGSVKDKMVDEFNHVKHVFDKKDAKDNDRGYAAVKQSDSEDECRYLEVLDDGMDLSVSQKYETERTEKLRDMELQN